MHVSQKGCEKMFREMVRVKQALSEEECISILKHEVRGVLSVLGDDDYPYGSPINHYYDEESGKIYFHGAKFGHKVDAMKKHDKVSFCVYDQGYHEEGDWALYIKSVIVFGRIRMNDICRKLCYKFTDDEEYIRHELEHSGPRTLLLELTPEHMTGKKVHEQ